MLRVAALAPVDVGRELTATVHVPPARIVMPVQPSASMWNWLGAEPPSATATVPVGEPPVFVTVNVWLVLVAPTGVSAKANGLGDTVGAPHVNPTPVSC